MIKLLSLFSLVALLNNVTWAQLQDVSSASASLTMLANDESALNGVLTETNPVALASDDAARSNHEEAKEVPSESNEKESRYVITARDLPKEVSQTLEKRYYARGFEGQNFHKIELADGTTNYSVDLVSPNMALFVMLNEEGRVFKAELK